MSDSRAILYICTFAKIVKMSKSADSQTRTSFSCQTNATLISTYVNTYVCICTLPWLRGLCICNVNCSLRTQCNEYFPEFLENCFHQLFGENIYLQYHEIES
jgi:hypothetical protein